MSRKCQLTRADLARLLPHAGAMCLLDAVVDWDAFGLHACSASHRRADNPLRADGVLHAVNLCEYAAQAMALHGALQPRAVALPAAKGWLVALRDVELRVERIDGLPGWLQVYVECLLAQADGRHYAFRIEHGGRTLAAGRAAVMLGNR